MYMGEKIFVRFSLFLMILLTLGLVLSWAGLFYKGIFLVLAIILLLKLAIFVLKEAKKPVLLVAVFAAISFVMVFFSTPSVFTGRDQGSYSEAAIRLSENHKLTFSTPASEEFFKIYGPGEALNFPGFHYTAEGELTTKFPLGYVVWLAIFYSIFGLSGFLIANGICIFAFLAAIYLVAKRLAIAKSKFLLILLSATAFPIFWFAKFTLSENLALALAWTIIFFVIKFIQERKTPDYFLLLSAAFLLTVTRIEGLLILPIIFAILLIKPNTRKTILENKKTFLFIPIIAVVAGIIINFSQNQAFSISIAKTIQKNILPGAIEQDLLSANFLTSQLFFLKVFALYGILQFIIGSILGFILAVRSKKFELLVPFLIALPALIYFIAPAISDDHPWMLRRYMFLALPAAIFYSVLLLEKLWLKKGLYPAMLLFAVLWIPSWPALARYLTFYENKDMLGQVEKISEKFSENDLILVPRNASGDGWSMISGPLSSIYHENAVYSVNPSDLDKINTSRFDNIYLITPAEEENFYAEYANYGIETQRLEIQNLEDELNLKEIRLPEKEDIEMNGIIFKIDSE